MEITIPDYEQKLMDKKRTSITLRLSALQVDVLDQIFWGSKNRKLSYAEILRTALCEFVKTHYNVNLPLDFRNVE